MAEQDPSKSNPRDSPPTYSADPHRANGMKADHVTERERMELIGATLSKLGAGSETERGETR